VLDTTSPRPKYLDQGNPNVEDSSIGDTTKIDKNVWPTGNKELEEINTGPTAYSTFQGSSIPSRNKM
jgi:hypothetical protein